MNEMESRKKIVLIIPSDIVARGFESILSGQGDFLVLDNLVDYSKPREVRLRNLAPDIIIIDPSVFDFQGRKEGRLAIAELCDASAISLYDDSVGILKKIHSADDSRQPDVASDGDELSAREKEILVCVAQGMLNKEIADKFSLSIYTVITHRKNITRKTGIKTVAGLTVYAILNNLIDINSVQ